MSNAEFVQVRLNYGDILLVPADEKGWWHLPGQHRASTEQLLTRAKKDGVTVRLIESSCDGETTTRLN